MDCPKCVGKLETVDVEGEKLDVCWVCEGIWFDNGELEKVISADSKNFKQINVDREEFDGVELAQSNIDLDNKKGKCPRCQDLMAQSRYKNDVLIDRCSKGHGIWLDGGEIHKLRKRQLVEFIYSCKFIFSEEGFLSLLGRFRGK